MMEKPVLLTGASGALGRVLTEALVQAGCTLVASDLVPYPGVLPAGVRFVQADLGDQAAVLGMAQGVGTILHFGGLSVEHPFEPILHANLRGTYHAFEAARAEGARVVFASSNHTVGFHERTTRLDEDCAFRPDGYYGLSKAYGELLARLYFDKHGVESVSLRIGSCRPEPVERRMLSTWLSYPDLVRLVLAAMTAPDVGCLAVWGTSDNPRSWWSSDAWQRIGYVPQDNAEAFAGKVDMSPRDPVYERYQGGAFPADGYSR